MRELLFPRTLGRLAYLWRHLPLNLLGLVQLSHLGTIHEWTAHEIGLLGLFAVILGYGILFVYLPRIRDCGMSTWTLLAAMIPYLGNLLGVILYFKSSAVLRVGMRSIPDSGLDTSRCSLCGRIRPANRERSGGDGSGRLCLDCPAIPPGVQPPAGDPFL